MTAEQRRCPIRPRAQPPVTRRRERVAVTPAAASCRGLGRASVRSSMSSARQRHAPPSACGCRSAGAAASRCGGGSRANSGGGADVVVRRPAPGPGRCAIVSLIRPGRVAITATRCPRKTASSMSWVMNTTVVPVAARSRAAPPGALAGLGVEGAERLVHQQHAPARSRGCGRWRRAASCRRRARAGSGWRTRSGRRARGSPGPARRARPCSARRGPRARTRCWTGAVRQGSRVYCWKTTLRSRPGPGDQPCRSTSDLAAGRAAQAGDQVQDGGLAAAAGPDEGEELAGARPRGRGRRGRRTRAASCRRCP